MVYSYTGIATLQDPSYYMLEVKYHHNSNKDIPAYTLQDILEKLPNEIVFYTFIYNLGLNTKNCPVYIMNDSNGDFLKYANNIDLNCTPLDAAYQLFLWCLENNYIKINEKH